MWKQFIDNETGRRSEIEFSVQEVSWEVPLGSIPAEVRGRKEAKLTQGGIKLMQLWPLKGNFRVRMALQSFPH